MEHSSVQVCTQKNSSIRKALVEKTKTNYDVMKIGWR